MTKTPTIAFIGAGNMANALIGGMLKQGFAASDIIATDPYQPSLDAVCEQYGIRSASDNAAAAEQADVIMLAVKPQVLEQAIAQFRPVLAERKPMLVSIVAGIKIDSIAGWAQSPVPIVRCMPNTPALLQLGATALYGNDRVNAELQTIADSMLGAVGITAWVEREELLDAVTAVSGSGPAYFFAVMESMQQIGESMGLDAELARQFVLQTALGAAQMASQSDVDVAELRRRVSSPGGTTLAALQRLQDGGLHSLLSEALGAAQARAVEMAEELGTQAS